MGDGDAAIEAHALRKRFGTRVVVDGLDLRVARGAVFGFLGANGAGKTTTIRMLLGLTQITGGVASLCGFRVPGERRAALARVGALVEEPGFHKCLSGRENLAVAAACRSRGASRRIDGALERVGLADRGQDRVGTYSLGMRQRLGVARCLLADPELLILDEPVNGLDPGGIREMRALIRSFAAEGRTVFLASHLLDEVQRICDHVAIIDAGQTVAEGPTRSLLGPDVLVLEVDDAERGAAVIGGLSGVRGVERSGAADLRVEVDDAGHALVVVPAALAVAGVRVARVDSVPASLEDLFLRLSGTARSGRP